MQVKIKLDAGGIMPVKKTVGAACYDCYANIQSLDGFVSIKPFQTVVIPLGFKCEFEEGYEMDVRGRSGNSLKGLVVQLGCVDSDYRGTVGAIVCNTTDKEQIVSNGDRIAQIIFHPVIESSLIQTEELSDTARGEGGFGSTGR